MTALGAALPQRRAPLLLKYLQEQLGPRLGLEPAEIGPRDNLMDLGVDSLKAIELKSLLETELGVELSSSLVFDQPNLEALTGFLLDAAGLTTSEELSAEELADLLASELRDLQNPSGKNQP